MAGMLGRSWQASGSAPASMFRSMERNRQAQLTAQPMHHRFLNAPLLLQQLRDLDVALSPVYCRDKHLTAAFSFVNQA